MQLRRLFLLLHLVCIDTHDSAADKSNFLEHKIITLCCISGTVGNLVLICFLSQLQLTALGIGHITVTLIRNSDTDATTP